MKNPYTDGHISESRVVFAPIWRWIFSISFFAGILFVPARQHWFEFKKSPQERWLPLFELWNHSNAKSYNFLFQRKSQNPLITRTIPNLSDHLRSFEEGIKDSELRLSMQRSQQHWITGWYQQGNRKVHLGENGWLYYRPGIEALTGKGPFVPEPNSVTKDPDRPKWKDPLSAISHFSRQLKERNIDLMIVPLPIKPMIETEGLGLKGILRHPHHDEFLRALRDLGIEAVDLLPWFAEEKQRGEVGFLRQDSHWTAERARKSAQLVAEKVRAMPWYETVPKSPSPEQRSVSRSAQGDLAMMLNLPGRFKDETQILDRVLDIKTGRALEGDLDAPVSILGDSFINIFEEPGLGFGDDADPGLIGAGFASHFAAYTGLRPHVIAINGEGASGVRRAFAALPDNVVKSRKLVIWAIAWRDFFLTESAARRAGVTWHDVAFNPASEKPIPDQQEGDGGIILTGILREKSVISDPQKTSYAEAIYSCIFDNLTVISGEYYEEEAYVFLWAFRDRRLTPEAKLEPGKKYRIKLSSLEKSEELKRKTQLDDFNRFDLDRFVGEIELSHQ